MNRPPRLPSLLLSRLVRAALLAIPLAVFALAGCGGGVDGTGGSGGDGGDGSCSASKPCAKGDCVYPAGSCKQGAVGVCQEVFQCDGPPSGAVCGCDGKTIEGEYPGCGPVPAYDLPAACQVGTFTCGPTLSCKRNSEVCVVRIPGVPGPSSYECLGLDKAQGFCSSGIPSCNCLDLEKIGPGASCQEDADFQDTVTIAMP